MSQYHFNENFMREAIRLSEISVQKGGGPFGAVVVKGGNIVGKGHNMVTLQNDPTAHAEIVAIRDACKRLNTFQLEGCHIYTSCEPCPMCFGAIYWARPEVVFFANTQMDAAMIGFDDHFIYEQMRLAPERRKIPMIQRMRQEAIKVFQFWARMENKKEY